MGLTTDPQTLGVSGAPGEHRLSPEHPHLETFRVDPQPRRKDTTES